MQTCLMYLTAGEAEKLRKILHFHAIFPTVTDGCGAILFHDRGFRCIINYAPATLGFD